MRKMILLLFLPWIVFAETTEDLAYNMHVRVAGAPPTPEALNLMVAHLKNNDPIAAGMVAANTPNFADVLIPWLNVWVNEAGSSAIPLNDSTTTMVGYILSGRDWREVLNGRDIYIFNQEHPMVNLGNCRGGNDDDPGCRYQDDDNRHYMRAYQRNTPIIIDQDPNTPDTLISVAQTDVMEDLPNEAASGILTTRQFASEFYNGGTNRAPNYFLYSNVLCTKYEDIKDFNVPQEFIGVDVERAPGGDSNTFTSDCVGCHALQDGTRLAYVEYDWDDDRMEYTPGGVAEKYYAIVSEPNGYDPRPSEGGAGNTWTNYYAQGANADMGWNHPNSDFGVGLNSWATALANTDRFAECSAQRAFEYACYRKPRGSADEAKVAGLAQYFVEENFNMKKLIVNAAAWCADDSL